MGAGAPPPAIAPVRHATLRNNAQTTHEEKSMADVLIVDDEPDIRSLLGDILTDEGHETRMADTADAALGEINSRRPDLIVLDIWLQGSRMDGIEVLKSVKRDNPTCRC